MATLKDVEIRISKRAVSQAFWAGVSVGITICMIIILIAREV